MFTSNEILKRIDSGDIIIDPFDMKKLNPNSYNITLGDTLKVYTGDILDPKKENPTKDIKIPEEGLILYPNNLYLGTTQEYTYMSNCIGCIDGRSSIGRLGIQIHLTAGFGDIGFGGHWTLEINVVHPVRVYAGMEIGQIYFEDPTGDIGLTYCGKYLNQIEPVESRMFKEYED